MKIHVTDHGDNHRVVVREKDFTRNYFKSMREIRKFLKNEDYKIVSDNSEVIREIRVEKNEKNLLL